MKVTPQCLKETLKQLFGVAGTVEFLLRGVPSTVEFLLRGVPSTVESPPTSAKKQKKLVRP